MRGWEPNQTKLGFRRFTSIGENCETVTTIFPHKQIGKKRLAQILVFHMRNRTDPHIQKHPQKCANCPHLFVHVKCTKVILVHIKLFIDANLILLK